MATKKGMGESMLQSLDAEKAAVQKRLEKAEITLGGGEPREVPTPEQAPVVSPRKEQKVIRDSFTFPQADYEKIKQIKDRLINLATNVTKSEVVRAGVLALEDLSDEELLDLIQRRIERVKPGRPAKG